MFAPIFDFAHATRVVPGSRIYRRFGKRLLDLSLVVLAAPFVLPLLAVLVVLTMATGLVPPLYAQTRVGRDGRPFRMWKIRTMVRDADGLLERLIATDPEIAREWMTRQKLTRDPRVTPFGRLLRRTSLDELPQLWNVLNGTMSLVGPRPFTPEQRRHYRNARPDVAYYRVRPGLTGLWQVGPRHLSAFEDRASHDDLYWQDLSLALDLSILMRTFGAVLRGSGC